VNNELVREYRRCVMTMTALDYEVLEVAATKVSRQSPLS
jgi:hypothetical protein